MQKTSLWLVGTTFFFACLPAPAQTQSGYGGFTPRVFRDTRSTRPPVSPYLNLLNGSLNPGVTYQGIIRPEIQAQSSFGVQQRQLDKLNTQVEVNPSVAGNLRSDRRSLSERAAAGDRDPFGERSFARAKTIESGHPSSFLNRKPYFQRFPGNGQRQ